MELVVKDDLLNYLSKLNLKKGKRLVILNIADIKESRINILEVFGTYAQLATAIADVQNNLNKLTDNVLVETLSKGEHDLYYSQW